MPECHSCRARAQDLAVLCQACGKSYTVRTGARPHPAEGGHTLLGTLLSDRFVLVNVIGSGATGIVYEAIQQPVGRICAVKVLRSELIGDDGARKRFEREATAASRLNHPHLVTLYDFGSLEGRRQRGYLAMEYVEGTELTKLAPYDGLDIDITVSIIRQLLKGVAAAHALGIVHRDLKPANMVLVQRSDNPCFLKVLDFGLARLISEASRPGESGGVFGTPLYMSPEQALSEPTITAASDLYSIAAIAWELITGQPPFLARTTVAVLNQHISADVGQLRPRPGLELLASLEPILRRTLSKSPEARQPGARALLNDIDEVLGLGRARKPRAPQTQVPMVSEDSDILDLDVLHTRISRDRPDHNRPGGNWLHTPPQGTASIQSSSDPKAPRGNEKS